MSCYHPLKGFPVGRTENGKVDYKITSFDVQYIARNLRTGKLFQEFDSPVYVPEYENITDYIEIPCGHCIGCRLKYSSDWANRMMLEAKEHQDNLFLTLTYNNKFLPKPNECVIDTDTGEIGSSPVNPLVKKDIQLFMKRLRKKFPDQKIRFFCSGEYGSQSLRPHYHLILFGLKLDDLEPFGSNELGQQYYISPTIEELWTHPELHKKGVPPYYDKEKLLIGSCYGYHKIGQCTWETCAYTARYVTKKLNGDKAEIYDRYNFPPEFSLMSRKPGIARNFYDNNKDMIYDSDEMFLNLGLRGSKKVKPPRYYDKLYDIDYPLESAILKETRQEIAENLAKVKSNLTSLTYQEQLLVDEEHKIAHTKILKRKDL